MLAIRMQRTGRKGHAMFRVIVQDSRRTPTSGKVVARLGSYDPHAKTITLDKEKASFYLDHGAQPSDRVARLLKNEGVKLPDWVTLSANKERTVRNADKRRSTRPADATPPEPATEELAAETEAVAPAVESTETTEAVETPAEKPEVQTEAPTETTDESAPEAHSATAETTEADAPAESESTDAAPAEVEATEPDKN